MGDDEDSPLPPSVPEPIRAMADSRNAIEALGSMIWFVTGFYYFHLILPRVSMDKVLICLISGICANSILTRIF